jgi:transcriptional regulator with XRE-family HTH domain
MDDVRIGTALRTLRFNRRWSQSELARRAGVSQATVSLIERGKFGSTSLRRLRAVCKALDAHLDIKLLWRGGELDRLINRRHSAMHEAAAGMFASLNGWTAVPEVSYSIYGERGVIDILAWHAATRNVLVVELKTEIVDVQELIGRLDQKRRLAPRIARERGWVPEVGRRVGPRCGEPHQPTPCCRSSVCSARRLPDRRAAGSGLAPRTFTAARGVVFPDKQQ